MIKLASLFLAILFLTGCGEASSSSSNADPTRQLTIIARDGRAHIFEIELALTPQQQAQGLMDRTEMPKDHGMLFYFGSEAKRSFWMKNTLIPLDMVFIRSNGVIANVRDSAVPNDLTSVHSDGEVAAVLELNGGVAKKLGIVAGDKAMHPFFGNSR